MKLVIEVSSKDMEAIRKELRALQADRYQDVSEDAICTAATLRGLREMLLDHVLSQNRKEEDKIIRRGLFQSLLPAEMG